MLSPTLAAPATDAADGHLGRANAGHPRREEREVNGVTASVAHRDFNEARSGSGEAWGEAGHGDELTAVLRPGLGKNGSVRSCRKVELALGGAIESRELCEAGEALGWIGKGAIEANLELDEPLPVGAPVAKKRSAITGEKGTSRSTSPAAAPLCHGRGHAL